MSDNVFAPPVSDIAGEPVAGRRGQVGVALGIIEKLEGSRPWVLLLSVMGFISVVFLVFGAMALLLADGNLAQNEIPTELKWGMGLAYLVIALLYTFPSLFLFRYARKIKAVRSEGLPGLEEALDQQRKFWAYVGMMIITFIILWLLFVVLTLLEVFPLQF